MTLIQEWGILFLVGIVGLFFLSRIRKENIRSIVSSIRSILVGSMLFMFFSSTLAMGFFDIIAGGGGVFLLTNNNPMWAGFISLATTGVLLVTIFLSGDEVSKKMKISKHEKDIITLVKIIVMIIDVVLDSLFADNLGYGFIAGVNVPPMHWVFRVLIGGLSLIGEHVSLTIMFRFEDIEGLFMDILPSLDGGNKKTTEKNNKQRHQEDKGNASRKKSPNRPQYEDVNGRLVPKNQQEQSFSRETQRHRYSEPTYRPTQTMRGEQQGLSGMPDVIPLTKDGYREESRPWRT